jgi:hypothetical protein
MSLIEAGLAAAGASALSTGVRIQIDTIAGIYSGERSKQYFANYTSPNLIPSIDAMIAARNASLMDERIFWEASILSGVLPQESNSFPKLRDWAKAWQSVITNTFYRPDNHFVLTAMARGMCKKGDEDKVWQCYKFDNRVVESLADAYRIWPSISEAVSMWHRDLIPDERYKEYLQKSGSPNVRVRQDLQKLYQNHLTVGDYTTLWNRSAIFEPEWEQAVRTVSGLRNDDLEKLKLLSSGVPGPADLVRFSVRDAFDDAAAERQGLDEEFGNTGSFQYWMEAQGLGTTLSYEKPGPPESVEWPKLFWRAHWQLMSPTQSYVALQRLRPERMHLYQSLVPGLKPFTFEVLSEILRASDYVPEQRKWLAAISYAIPEQKIARELYQLGVIERPEFIEMLRDRGLRAEDAESNARLADIKKPYFQKRYLVPPMDRYDTGLYTSILDSFRNGAINDGDLRSNLMSILNNADVVNIVVQTEIIKHHNNQIKAFTAMVRRAYFTGEMSSGVAISTLTNGGVNNLRAQSLLNLWSVQLDLPRRVASARKLVDWYRHGSLTQVGLSDRLQRLGYAPDTILLTLAEGDRLISEDEAKRNIAAVRAAKAAAKEARQAHKEQLAADNRFRTIAAIKRWYKLGIIGAEQVRPLLIEMQTPESDLDKWELDIVGVPGG